MVDFRDRVDRVLQKCTKVLGECVTYYPKSGGSYKIRAIFDNEYENVDPETEKIISSNQPALGVNLNDIKPTMRKDDMVQVRNLKYRVIEIREDGQGGATLFLHKCEHEKKVYKKKNSRSA